MTNEYIKIEDLEINGLYEVSARNFRKAMWDGERFYGIRDKFGSKYISGELHWDSDPHYGTVKPFELITILENIEQLWDHYG